jgi:hypothetical protein
MENKKPQHESKTPPYISFSTFLTALNLISEHGVPNVIERGIFTNFSGLNQRLILLSFRFMGFTNDDYTPTEKLKEYAKADPEKRKEILGFLIKERFKKQTEILPNGTINQLRDSFDYTGVETSVKAKIVGFFVQAAKEAGYQISPYILKGTRTRGPRSTGSRRKQNGEGEEHNLTLPLDKKEKFGEGMTRLPIPIGHDKIWHITVSKDYTKDDVERFIQIIGIVLGIK